MKILIVDDERDICRAIADLMQKQGHETASVYDGDEAMEAFAREKPDLVLLDVMLPNVNGFQLCEQIRSEDAHIPILMLSAKNDLVDKSVGFSAGCDDYIAKPFSSAELVMRIEAGLRRVRAESQGESRETPRKSRAKTQVGDLEVRFKDFEVLKGGRHVSLTPKEFQIVAFLANHPGEVFTAQDITRSVWGDEYESETTSIAVFIRKIRRKIEDDPSKPKLLQTVWHEGYRLGDPVEKSDRDTSAPVHS